MKADAVALSRVMCNAGVIIGVIADMLTPFLPETAKRIREQIAVNDQEIKIRRGNSLFPRLG